MEKNDELLKGSWLQRFTLFIIGLICVVGSLQADDELGLSSRMEFTQGTSE